VTLHNVVAAFYCLAGAFQCDRGLRGSRPVLHRVLGPMAAACGVTVAVTGLWLTITSGIRSSLQGDLLRVVRIAVGAGMAACLVLGVAAIRAGHVRTHQVWMARAYALAQGAGTQALLLLPPTIAFGEITGRLRDSATLAVRLPNLWVVEAVVVRPVRFPAV
jgi:uncharacterized membrane protein